MSAILIIDDDKEICETLESLVTRLLHTCISVRNIQDGRDVLQEQNFDLVFLDVRLPDGNGLDLVPEILEQHNAPEVIILTGQGDPDGAGLAIEGGAWDYLLKPSSVQEIRLALDRALRYRREKLNNKPQEAFRALELIGESNDFKNICTQLSQASRSDVNLLLTGETGTGKELFARAIHENSSRKNNRFVVVDCASLTESLVESILFGHRKGAFTGAHDNQSGLFKLADGGTLFLDELGEMPLNIQKTFLRVLQEHTFRAVGDPEEQKSDFRLIAATNQNLEEMVEDSAFRSDLLYRVQTMMIPLPPLRQRKMDIRPLTYHKINKLTLQYNREEIEIGEDFFAALEDYSWPGNVRELFNVLERAVVALGSEKKLFAMHLPRSLRAQVAREKVKKVSSTHETVSAKEERSEADVRKIGQDLFLTIFDKEPPTLRDFKNIAIKMYLTELVRQEKGDIPAILKISGLSRSHFYALVKKHFISLHAQY